MERLKENISYQNIILCPKCSRNITYHVTDIKGVSDDKHIICPACGEKLYINLEKVK